ncbi:aldehyde dehydrogenase family protein, partial [Haemophilus parainfluenzae]|uniref:aldehyde dehydrogenase family protein n=1 Tax=Haemophilus parainfluenzae TaxID=729 RepID=UPI00124B24AB
GIEAGAAPLVDGRQTEPELAQGNFIRPTLLGDIAPDSELATTEIFGPVLGLMAVESLEQAIALVNQSRWGNMACLFTSSGAAARQFRYEAAAGNIGINIGVAAPMAFFPF